MEVDAGMLLPAACKSPVQSSDRVSVRGYIRQRRRPMKGSGKGKS